MEALSEMKVSVLDVHSVVVLRSTFVKRGKESVGRN